jgi:hypothetical protein
MIILAIDVGGTIQLAVTNALGNPVLDESNLISTTAITTGSNSATGIYSTTTASNAPFRVLGYFYVTEATAGVWLTNPSLVSGAGALTQPGADSRYMSISYSQFGTFISSNTNISLADKGKNFQISAGVATLPAPIAGLRYRFIGATPGAGSVAVPTGVALQYPDGTYALAGTSLTPTNSTIDLFSDGVSWIITSMSGLQYIPSATSMTNPSRADQVRADSIQITAVPTANALVVTLNPCILSVRNSNISSGAANIRIISAPMSVTIPPGATLGTTNGAAYTLAVVAIDTAGIVELAVVNPQFGVTLLGEDNLISTSAMSVTSSATGVFYSTTTRTNVPYRVLGYINVTEAIAGTWSTAPTVVHGENGVSVAMLLGASVYNATKWAGGTKTVSTAGPSGGVDGDVWFQRVT